MGETEKVPQFPLSVEGPTPLTPAEIQQREYNEQGRYITRANAHAQVVKKQLADAYEILDNISFECLGDTMFRDYIFSAKERIAGALGDFLLSDAYWEEKKKKHRKMTPAEYAEYISSPMKQPTQSQGQPS